MRIKGYTKLIIEEIENGYVVKDITGMADGYYKTTHYFKSESELAEGIQGVLQQAKDSKEKADKELQEILDSIDSITGKTSKSKYIKDNIN